MLQAWFKPCDRRLNPKFFSHFPEALLAHGKGAMTPITEQLPEEYQLSTDRDKTVDKLKIDSQEPDL